VAIKFTVGKRLVPAVFVVGEAPFFAAPQIRVMRFPVTPRGEWGKRFEIPSLSEKRDEKVGCWGRRFPDSKPRVLRLVDEKDGTSLRSQYPGQ